MTNLVADYDNGLQYLFAASILAGILQLFWGVIKIANQLKFVSRAVMIGFVNALAILIFMAQLPELSLANSTWLIVYAMVAGALAIIYLLPRVTTVVPAPLVAIIIITMISLGTNSGVPTVGDRGALPTAFPSLGIPQVSFSFETLQIIFPYAIAISMVGLLESFLTANLAQRLKLALEVLYVTDRRGEQALQTPDFSGNIGVDSYQQLLKELVELEAARAKINHQRAKIILQEAQQFFSDRHIPNVKLTHETGFLVDLFHKQVSILYAKYYKVVLK